MSFRRIFGANRANAQPRPRRPLDSQDQAGWAELALSTQALRQLNRLHLNAGRYLPGEASGTRSSQRRRPEVDFREHRMYTPGDDVRFVDWRASARQEHIFIKQGEQLKDAAIYVLLDCSASMAWGDPPKSQVALTLAMAFAYLALAHGDRLTVVPLQGQKDVDVGDERQTIYPSLGPISGKGQFPGVLNYLRGMPFHGRVDLTQSLASFSRRFARRRGLVLVLSDLLGMRQLSAGLEALPTPGWNVVICHLLHPAEIDPGLSGYFEMQDIETGKVKNYAVTPKALETYRQRFQAWQAGMETACLDSKARYTLIPTHWSLETEIIPRLREAHLVKAL